MSQVVPIMPCKLGTLDSIQLLFDGCSSSHTLGSHTGSEALVVYLKKLLNQKFQSNAKVNFQI